MSGSLNRYTAPPGYESFTVLHAHSIVTVVAEESVAAAVRNAMHESTLYDFAARSPAARALAGRATAWAATLPGGTPIVVRHGRHGGTFAPLTRDLFLVPTRAPHELDVSLRLAAAGVPTPRVAAYAVYPAFGPFARADVATIELAGMDFPDAWKATSSGSGRTTLLAALAELLRALRTAGAMHPDLNLKNIFVTPGSGTPGVDSPTASVLDVDRVEFGPAGSAAIAEANLKRLVRSARKWRAKWGLDIDEFTDLAPLAGVLGLRPESARP